MLSKCSSGIMGIMAFLLIIVGNSCKPDKVKNIPDVSNIDLNINIKRLDKSIFEIDTTNIERELERLNNEYPEFMDIYLHIMQKNAKTAKQTIENSVTPQPMRHLYDTCQIVYTSVEALEESFEESFKYLKHYFPTYPTPEVITCITALNYGAFTIEDSILAISLDFFLGEDFPLYQGLFPKYVSKYMNRDNIVKKGMEAIVNNIVPMPRSERMLDWMIYNGKRMYILDKLLPYTPDSIKWSFTQNQVDWCKGNEVQMWAFFLEKELFYSTKRIDFQKYVDESPNSPGMPREAPGRTGNWMGWKIVERYMERHPETSLEKLAKTEDVQTILSKSRYKPR